MCKSDRNVCKQFFFLRGKGPSLKICPEVQDTSEVANEESSPSDPTAAISLVPVCVFLLPSISDLIYRTQIGKGHQVLVPHT